MPDITYLLDSAVDDEPAYAPDLDAILTGGRRQRRRRRTVVAGSGVALTAGIGALAVALATTGASAPRHTPAAAAPAARLAASSAVSSSAVSSRSAAVDTSHGVTRDNLARLVEQDASITLSDVDVAVLSPTDDIDLGAGIASAQGQYLNVQVNPAGTSDLTPPTCDQLNGYGAAAGDWDLYRGACRVESLGDGGYLTIRTARTLDGRYAITQADLVAGDGSAISVEASNQLNTTPKRLGSGYAPRIGAVVSQDPPLSADQLVSLAHALNAQR